MLAAQIGHGRAGFRLLENADDLAIAVAGFFHVEVPLLPLTRIFHLSALLIFGGITRA